MGISSIKGLEELLGIKKEGIKYSITRYSGDKEEVLWKKGIKKRVEKDDVEIKKDIKRVLNEVINKAKAKQGNKIECIGWLISGVITNQMEIEERGIVVNCDVKRIKLKGLEESIEESVRRLNKEGEEKLIKIAEEEIKVLKAEIKNKCKDMEKGEGGYIPLESIQMLRGLEKSRVYDEVIKRGVDYIIGYEVKEGEYVIVISQKGVKYIIGKGGSDRLENLDEVLKNIIRMIQNENHKKYWRAIKNG